MALMTTETMDFETTAMLCDSATSAEGKLYLQGAGWDLINPPNGAYPTRIPRIGIGALIAVPYPETNKNHSLTLSLKGADGEDIALGMQPADPRDPASVGVKPLYQLEASFNMGRPPYLQHGQSQTIPFAMNIDGLEIESPGAYYFVFEIDGHESKRLTFTALPVGQGQIVVQSR